MLVHKCTTGPQLTGNTLVSVDEYDESKMVAIVRMMNELAIDNTLSKWVCII